MNLDEVADRLYAAPPETFVQLRTEAVKAAREAGDRALAKAIGGLRRPTRSAWLVNLLARSEPGELTRLLDLGTALREAQASLAGAELRRLSAERHRAVDALARRAREVGAEHGYSAPDAVEQEISQTLQAALADPELGEQVRRGRVATAVAYGGFGPLEWGPPPAPGEAPPEPSTESPPEPPPEPVPEPPLESLIEPLPVEEADGPKPVTDIPPSQRGGQSRSTAGRTVGVEEELLLVDTDTGVPSAVAAATLHRFDSGPDDASGGIAAELQQEQLEIETAPVTELAELDDIIRHWRRAANEAARAAGASVAALATSPLPVAPVTTIQPRYLQMVEHFGLTTTEQLTCGCHVHVGIGSAEEGVAVLDRIRVWLPVLLALSANSPYWQGQDSGYASYRSRVWARFPSAGPTDPFGSPARYHQTVGTMVRSGVVLDEAMLYFDARLSHRYPTVEIRAPDVCLRAEDTVTIAALARALVETAASEWGRGEEPPAVATPLLRLASWRAARSGLSGELLDPYDLTPRPAWDVVRSLVDHVRPALADTGDEARVEAALDRLRVHGSGADWQRAALNDSGDLAAVVALAAGETIT